MYRTYLQVYIHWTCMHACDVYGWHIHDSGLVEQTCIQLCQIHSHAVSHAKWMLVGLYECNS